MPENYNGYMNYGYGNPQEPQQNPNIYGAYGQNPYQNPYQNPVNPYQNPAYMPQNGVPPVNTGYQMPNTGYQQPVMNGFDQLQLQKEPYIEEPTLHPEPFVLYPVIEQVIPEPQPQEYPPTPTVAEKPKQESAADTLRNSFAGNEFHPELNDKLAEIEKKHKPKRRSIFAILLSRICPMIIGVCIAVACVLICRTFVYDVMTVSGTSMLPTYKNNDVVGIEKWYYFLNSPTYNDVIVADLENGDSIIKRIVACPGDTLYIADGVLYVNDQLQETELEPMIDAGIASSVIILGEGEYFVLGDNRNGSTDSRSSDVGIITKDQIEGRVTEETLPSWLATFQ